VLTGDEPPDVSNYAAAHPEFPHETTTDQWFSESQLESYRLLGLHAVETICGEDWKPKTLPLFFDQIKGDLAAKKSKERFSLASKLSAAWREGLRVTVRS
jgi:hypothetical protein